VLVLGAYYTTDRPRSSVDRNTNALAAWPMAGHRYEFQVALLASFPKQKGSAW